eukprot:CAMPEP_0116101212 /NCGR_PEP_ID=MMETSP0327-20121206/12692_1 /TAXON_ID=44447 /ORGANISM="Pseudo-nitzschia delicatissima, Strain B596" /LENGTH=274 /DNA_ID=CAMNT_0003593163 /DNA_START=30 /DNA_END=854 /DNA_ORIENTATION=-
MNCLLRKGIPIQRFGKTEKIVEGLSRNRQVLSSTRSFSSPSSQPVVELRDDFLFPKHSKAYYDHFEDFQDESDAANYSRLCFVTRSELGGPLHAATHAYYFSGGLAELQEQRMKEETTENTSDLNAFIRSQQSSVYVEAPLVKEQSDFVIGLENTTVGTSGENAILELRRYNLKLGYDTVPKFLDLYGAGLPSKIQAQDPTTSLVTLLYSEVGRLNEVIEIWSHGDGVPAMERSRVAARKAQEWRGAIASIADLAIEFRSTIHRPILAPCPTPK